MELSRLPADKEADAFGDVESVSQRSSTSSSILVDDTRAAYRRSTDQRRSLDSNDETQPFRDEDQSTRHYDDWEEQSGARKISYWSYRPASVLALWFVVTLVSFALGRGSVSTNSIASTDLALGRDVLPGGKLSGARNSFAFSNGTAWQRPSELKIIGIVFYGRRQFVDILDCYLRRNLAVNGGILDEVHFLMHTADPADQHWLENLVRRHKLEDHYILKHEDTKSPGWEQWGTYASLYGKYMQDLDSIYVKIDDDIMFVSDFAIPEMVRAALEHPTAHSIMANIVNNKRSHWFHFHNNAIYPYLPDREASITWPGSSWRARELPRFSGDIPKKNTWFSSGYPPPFKGHRWLPLLDPSIEDTEVSPEKSDLIYRTPFSGHLPDPTYVLHGPGVGWSVAAQAHYSLLENIDRGTLHKYYFGSLNDSTHNLWYMHWNINFFAISGRNLAKLPFWPPHEVGAHNDEELLSEIIPRELNMPSLVATKAVVSHLSFKGDRDNVLQTDLLDRYRAYANEMVCGPSNQKRHFGQKNPHHQPSRVRPETPIDEDPNGDDVGDGPGDTENGGDQDDGRLDESG